MEYYIIAVVYLVAVVLAVIGVAIYSVKLKKEDLPNTHTQVKNTGFSYKDGVNHLKTICK